MTQKTKLAPIFEIVEEQELFALHRNGRYLMTPAGKAFAVPYPALAETIAEEWRAQGEKIVPASMPMTQMTATALDIVGPDRNKTIEGLLAYTSSELLCQRAEWPESLPLKQEEVWQPLLNWCAEKYGTIFSVGCGVMPVRQKPELKETLRRVLEDMNDYRLAGLSCAADSAGSLVLGLALAEGARTATEILKASELDVTHQASTWGDDPVTQARQTALKHELEACEKWFALIGA